MMESAPILPLYGDSGPVAQTQRELRDKAQLFVQLRTQEAAGIPVAQAFGVMAEQAEQRGGQARLARQLRLVATRLEAGWPLVKAGERAGLFSEQDAALLSAYVEVGETAAGFGELAHEYALAHAAKRRFKSKMLWPGFVVFVAAVTRPLPALAGGQISGASYLIEVALTLLQAALLVWVLIRLVQHANSGQPGVLDRLSFKLPAFGAYRQRRCQYTLLSTLSRMLNAGLPMFSAIRAAVDAVPSAFAREHFESLVENLHGGASLATAMQSSAMLRSEVIGVVLAGEAAGTPGEALQRLVERERVDLDQEQGLLLDWALRALYVVLIAWVLIGWLS